MISQSEKRNICNVCETESWTWDIDRIENRDEVSGCAIDKECHRICVCHVKDIGRLAYWNLRGQRCSSSPWHGYLPTTFDY